MSHWTDRLECPRCKEPTECVSRNWEPHSGPTTHHQQCGNCGLHGRIVDLDDQKDDYWYDEVEFVQ